MTGLRQRRFGLGTGLVAMGMSLWASTAWACTPTAELEIVGPDSGRPGSTTRIEGRNFLNDQVGVYLVTEDGREVARLWSGRGPTIYPVSVTVPSVPPGSYLVEGRSGQYTARGGTFTVDPDADQAAGDPVQPPPSRAGSDADTSPVGKDVAQPEATAGSTSSTAEGEVPQVGQAAQPATTAGRTAPTAGGAKAPAAPRTATAPAVPGAGAPGEDAPPTAGDASAAPLAPVPEANPSPRSATDDPASGFSGSSRRSVGPPSLTARAAAARERAGLPIGLGLLTMGLGTLAVLAGVGAVRRHRAVASRR